MIYRKTNNYDHFRCIADKCPENCCGLWQIVIDDEALEKYNTVSGSFGEELKDGIDFEEGCFKQHDRKCSQLMSNGLCKLHSTLGEEYLCYTCQMYPRHIEEFDGEREYSISLSCPEAARIILASTEPITFTEWETEEEDDFEDFDFILYSKLFDAREIIFFIVKNRKLSIIDRMNIILDMADDLQDCLSDEDIFAIDDVTKSYKEKNESHREYDHEKEMMYFLHLYELENLHDDWHDLLDKARFIFSDKEFELSSRMEICAEQLLMFFVYTYFLGAVYDDMIDTKLYLSVYSVRWILYLYEAIKNSDDDIDALIKAAYTYAREIEHSDINIEDLEEFFSAYK